MMKASEYLGHARETIANGWCQGTIRRPIVSPTEHCIIGALTTVNCDNLEAISLGTRTLTSKLPEVGWHTNLSLPSFNDDDESTKQQDVLHLFDKAINSLQEIGE